MSTKDGKNSQRPPPPPDPVLVLSGKDSVTSLVFVDNDVILTGHQNGKIQEWSLPIRRVVTNWSGHSDTVLWLAKMVLTTNVNDAQILLLSQGRDGLVKVWTKDSNNPTIWTTIDQVSSAPLIFCGSAVIYSTSQTLLATPSEETSIVNIHNINNTGTGPSSQELPFSLSKSPIRVLKPCDIKSYGMCMRICSVSSPSHDSKSDGNLLVGYESGTIALWDALVGEMTHSLKIHNDSVMSLSCWLNTTSGQIIGLSASVNNLIQCWKISDNKTIIKDNVVSVINDGFNDIAIRKDGRIFLTGGWDSRGRVFGLKKLRPLAVLSHHKESINCVGFGPNNELVLASKDGYITLWDIFKNS